MARPRADAESPLPPRGGKERRSNNGISLCRLQTWMSFTSAHCLVPDARNHAYASPPELSPDVASARDLAVEAAFQLIRQAAVADGRQLGARLAAPSAKVSTEEP